MPPEPDFEALIAAAKEVRPNGYAPYSVYRVGAALLGADGRIFTGCNVENVSYGASICAERMAVGAMVAGGCQEWVALAVYTKDGGSPCGMCRQVLAEFERQSGASLVIWCGEDGSTGQARFSELLPDAFRSQSVRKEL